MFCFDTQSESNAILVAVEQGRPVENKGDKWGNIFKN